MKKIVIIGGGLAGLTTAYFLSKNPELEIEIYEAREILGGRVQTVEVDGFKFNYGAFMTFSWYKNFNKLLEDLQYTHYSEHLDGEHEYAWDEENNTFHEIHKHWVFDDVPVQKLIKFLPDFLIHKPELYNPDPARFNMMSAEEYFSKLEPDDVKSLDALNRVAVGYTYGAISQLPMSVYFGFAKEVLLNKGFKNVTVLTEGAYKIIDLLERTIKSRNVTIYTSASMSISKQKEVLLRGRRIEYDYLVVASAFGNLVEPFLPNISNPITYNDHFVAYVKTENMTAVNGRFDWNLLYTGSLQQNEPQLTCIGNFEATFPEHPEKSLITYLRIPPSLANKYDDEEAKSKIIELIGKYLPDAGKVTIGFLHRWKNTMPIISLDALERIQSIQGKDNIFFAGDYLGAPSMEVAVQSGEKAAELITESVKLNQKRNS